MRFKALAGAEVSDEAAKLILRFHDESARLIGVDQSLDFPLESGKARGDSALALLGKIVNGADTDNTLYRQAEGPGLQAIAEGFRHLGYKDDHALNAAEWIVYDALYAYALEMVKRGKPAGQFAN